MDEVTEDGRFEWDEEKAGLNLLKHGASFEEAASVFDDSLSEVFDDEDHSGGEGRYLLIGHSSLNRLLVVCYTVRGERFRVISARSATRGERRAYEERSF